MFSTKIELRLALALNPSCSTQEKTAGNKLAARIILLLFVFIFYRQKGHVRELELEPGKKYKMITLASKPPIFGKKLTVCLRQLLYVFLSN